MATKSVRPVKNVSAEVFVAEVIRQAELENGCIESLAKELGLTVNSAYARYAKYRKEMKAATGTTLPKLPKSATRKATLDWTALANIVNTQTKDEDKEELDDDSTDSFMADEVDEIPDKTEGEANEELAEVNA